MNPRVVSYKYHQGGVKKKKKKKVPKAKLIRGGRLQVQMGKK